MSILFIPLFTYFLLSVVYFLFFALAGKIPRHNSLSIESRLNKIAILIPAYKEDTVIVDTAKRVVAHDYPTEAFDVFVLADELKNDTLELLQELPITVIQVAQQQRTKAKSLHQFFHSMNDGNYAIVMILDADNVMQDNCLHLINSAFINGSKVVQCHRIAKNRQNSLSILDAISEEIRINIFFAGHAKLGISAELIGSAMAFDFGILKDILQNKYVLESIGEDKEMTLQLMKKEIAIDFIENAKVLDEKVSNIEVFKKQRKRWIESQLKIVRRFFHPEFNSIRRKKIFWYRLFQQLLLPRSFYLILLPLLTASVFILEGFGFKISPQFISWLILSCLYFFSLFISIPISYLNFQTCKAIGKLPIVLFSMLSAASNARMNNKVFVSTVKGMKEND